MQGIGFEAAVAERRTIAPGSKRAIMAHSQFDQFLQEDIHRDKDSDSALDGGSFHGLHTSWCHVSQAASQARLPSPSTAPSAAAHRCWKPPQNMLQFSLPTSDRQDKIHQAMTGRRAKPACSDSPAPTGRVR